MKLGQFERSKSQAHKNIGIGLYTVGKSFEPKIWRPLGVWRASLPAWQKLHPDRGDLVIQVARWWKSQGVPFWNRPSMVDAGCFLQPARGLWYSPAESSSPRNLHCSLSGGGILHPGWLTFGPLALGLVKPVRAGSGSGWASVQAGQCIFRPVKLIIGENMFTVRNRRLILNHC